MAETANGEHCGSCRFRVPRERRFECHRFPPPRSDDWPTVAAGEWCGEWKSAGTGEDDSGDGEDDRDLSPRRPARRRGNPARKTGSSGG